MLVRCKNVVSSDGIASTLGIMQKSAWLLSSAVPLVLRNAGGGKLGGWCEVDETFSGGRLGSMHEAKRKKVVNGRGATGKTVVMGTLERGGKVKTHVTAERDKKTLHGKINDHVEPGAHVMRDELISYWGLEENYTHSVINHAEAYVDGIASTDELENFWSLLKRALGGTYVAVEPFHLLRYIDEQSFATITVGPTTRGASSRSSRKSQASVSRSLRSPVGGCRRRTNGKPVIEGSTGLSYRRQERGKRKP